MMMITAAAAMVLIHSVNSFASKGRRKRETKKQNKKKLLQRCLAQGKELESERE